MNKSEIAVRLASRMGLSKTATTGAVDAVFEAITRRSRWKRTYGSRGFGTFKTRRRPAQSGRNPRTGECVSIPASNAPVFKAGRTLRNAVNGRREFGSG